MRHSHTQNSSSLLFLVGSLVLTFSLASAKSFASETSQNSGKPSAPHSTKDLFKKAADEYKAKYYKAFAKASKEAYAKLTDEEKKLYSEIMLTAEGEYGTSMNKTQLVGFISFIKANPDATCAVADSTKENRKVKYTVFTDEKDKKKYGQGPNGGPGMILSMLTGGASDRGGRSSSAGLLCTAGDKKMFFTGLPARPLNDYYNKNIQLKGEPVPTNVADGNKPGEEPAPVPVPASTNVSGYMTQSTEDLRTEQEQTAFEGSAPTASQPEAASSLGFSKPVK